jgi:phosphohistidine phosphatase
MQELLVVRHAIARDRLESMAQDMADAHRPLTAAGRKKMAQAALGLQQLCPAITTILTSPLLRAQQTAEILGDYYPATRVSECQQLSPEYDTTALIHSLRTVQGKRLALVGHEPGLSTLITTLICGGDSGAIKLKKGGVALLQFTDHIAPGEGVLQWLLTPKQLHLMGKNA